VLVSFHLANSSQYIPEHSWASNAVNYFSAVGSGDHTADTSDTAFNGTGGSSWGYFTDVITGMDVVSEAGQPTVVTIGDGLVDNNVSGNHAVGWNSSGGASFRLANSLAVALRSNTQGVPDYGVVAGDVPGNHVVNDIAGSHVGGHSLLTRLDEDILTEPQIDTVVIAEGLQDIVSGTDDTAITSAYQLLLDQLQAWGIKTVILNVTPCDGYAGCTATADDNRQAVNQWVSDVSGDIWPGSAFIDANGAVAVDDPTSTAIPSELQLSAQAAPLDFDSGDHVNLSLNGYAAVAGALTNDLTVLMPAQTP